MTLRLPLLLSRLAGLSGLLFCFPSCLSGQIGGEVGHSEETSSSPNIDLDFSCEQVDERKIGLNEKTDLAITIADLVEQLTGEHQAPLQWQPAQQEPSIVISPPAGDSSIKVSIQPDVASAMLVETKAQSKNSSIPSQPELNTNGCGAFLRLDADVTITSGNGAFNEMRRVSFTAKNSLIIRAEIELEPGELEGNFDVDLSALEKSEISQTTMQLVFTLGQMSGSIRGLLTSQQGGAALGYPVDFGTFPIERCTLGYLVDPQHTWAKDITSKALSARSFNLNWNGQEATGFEFEPSVRQICIDTEFASGALRAHAALSAHVASTDEMIDGQWQIEANIELAPDGAPETMHAFRSGGYIDAFDSEEFESNTGISNISTEQAQLTFLFGYDVEFAANADAVGVLNILELLPPTCETKELSDEELEARDNGDGGSATPDCSSIEYREILGGKLEEVSRPE